MLKINKLYRLHVKFQKLFFKGRSQSKWFLFSLVLLILLPFPINLFPSYKALIFELSLSAVVFFGVQLVSDTMKHFLTGMLLGIISVCIIWLDFFRNDLSLITILKPITISLFLTYLSYYLMSFLKKTKIIDLNMILLSISGFLLLGIFGGQLCHLLHTIDTSSFNVDNKNTLFELTYYSFTTLTSLGFGDILPLTSPARSLSLIIGLAGELYITILVAILVGKYLIQNQS